MATTSDAPSLGVCLRALRVRTGGALDEMARATRISERYFRALEDDDFSELPAPVFVRGFIRAYCEFLGVPADEPLALYGKVEHSGPSHEARTFPARHPVSWAGHPVVVSGALLLVFGAGLLALKLAVRGGPPPVPAPVTTARESAPAPSAPPVPAPVPPTAAPPRSQAGSQRLVVKAVEPTWIRVQTDDGQVAEEMLAAGATREWTSGKRFLLTVGNAGGVTVELNGRPLPSLGARGAVIRRLSLPEGQGGS